MDQVYLPKSKVDLSRQVSDASKRLRRSHYFKISCFLCSKDPLRKMLIAEALKEGRVNSEEENEEEAEKEENDEQDANVEEDSAAQVKKLCCCQS